RGRVHRFLNGHGGEIRVGRLGADGVTEGDVAVLGFALPVVVKMLVKDRVVRIGAVGSVGSGLDGQGQPIESQADGQRAVIRVSNQEGRVLPVKVARAHASFSPGGREAVPGAAD